MGLKMRWVATKDYQWINGFPVRHIYMEYDIMFLLQLLRLQFKGLYFCSIATYVGSRIYLQQAMGRTRFSAYRNALKEIPL